MAGAEFLPNSADLEELQELSEDANEVSKTVDMTLVADFVKIRRQIEAYKTELTLLNKKYDSMQQTLMNQMLAGASKSIRTEDDVLISVRVTPYFSASDVDKRKFAEEFSRFDLLTINAQTFSSEIRKLGDDGKEIPPYVKEFQRKTLSVRGI